MSRAFATAALSLILLAGTAHADPAMKTTVLLKTSTTNIGQGIVYPSHGTPEITTMVIELAPGAATPLHTHPFPLVGYILAGQLEVRGAGGRSHRYKAGDSFVEAVGRPHRGINIGPGPVRILVTVVGVKGVPYAHSVAP
jgi:quercetin dioxygenase-like cupin family protein